MIMRYESSDGFKKGDLWSNSFIILMRDHYGVKCIMNRTDVWNERQKTMIYCYKRHLLHCYKTMGIVLKCN